MYGGSQACLGQHEMCIKPWVDVCRTNNYTQYYTSGAGSLGSQGDSCADPANYAYSNGGNSGFMLVTVNSSTWQVSSNS